MDGKDSRWPYGCSNAEPCGSFFSLRRGWWLFGFQAGRALWFSCTELYSSSPRVPKGCCARVVLLQATYSLMVPEPSCFSIHAMDKYLASPSYLLSQWAQTCSATGSSRSKAVQPRNVLTMQASARYTVPACLPFCSPSHFQLPTSHFFPNFIFSIYRRPPSLPFQVTIPSSLHQPSTLPVSFPTPIFNNPPRHLPRQAHRQRTTAI